MRKSILLAAAVVAASVNLQSFPATAATDSTTSFADRYVSSDNFSSGGKTYGPKDGIVHESGSVNLRKLATGQARPMSDTTSSTFRFGSSYASTTERSQYYYDGVAYASAKKDYQLSGPGALYRVVQVCFKYTRDGQDVIGWQCSKAGPGPAFTAGPVVRATVKDTLNPVAPQTRFVYDVKKINY